MLEPVFTGADPYQQERKNAREEQHEQDEGDVIHGVKFSVRGAGAKVIHWVVLYN